MTLSLTIAPDFAGTDFTPRITVIGVGGGGTNAVDNMIAMNLQGVEFVVANTDAQQLMHSRAEKKIQLGPHLTQGLGAGAKPEIGRGAAEEAEAELARHLEGVHMVFVTAGMGGGTGTGAAPVIARMAHERGILTIGVVTKPFAFEGKRRAVAADAGITEIQQYVDTLIIIPNQNLFRLANERTGWREAFKMADNVLYTGVRGVTDLMIVPGLINLDFADIRTVMAAKGKAMMGTGEMEGEDRARRAAEAAINNPLLEDSHMAGASGLLINITGGEDLTLFEVDAAVNRVREEVSEDAEVIFGSTIDETMNGRVRVSVVATGIDMPQQMEAERPRLVAVGGGAARDMEEAVGAPLLPPTPGPRMVSPVTEALAPAPNSQPAMAPGRTVSYETAPAEGDAPPTRRPVLQPAAQPGPRTVRPGPAPPPRTPSRPSPLFNASGEGHAAPRAAPRSLFGLVTGAVTAKLRGAAAESYAAEPPAAEAEDGPRAAVTAAGGTDPFDIPAFLRRQS